MEEALEELDVRERANVVIKQLDVTDELSIQKTVLEIVEAEKRLDALVNNAGEKSRI